MRRSQWRFSRAEVFVGFAIGDSVVVPGLGVGSLASIEEIAVGDDTSERVYRVEFGAGKGRIWVPVDRSGEVGLREVMSKDAAEHAFEVIKSQKAPKKRAHWNRRRQRYEGLLASDQPTEVAALVGELADVQRTKDSPLSFSEKRMLEKACDILVAELVAAMGVARATIIKRLTAAMGTTVQLTPA